VLVIDDDPRQIAELLRLPRHESSRITVARSGSSGLERARSHPPDVIVLRLELFDLHGFDVCRRLRAEPATAAVPIVMTAALDDTDLRHRGLRVGANVMLLRPFTPEQFDDAVARALGWRDRLRREGLRAEVELELDSRGEYLLEVDEFLEELCRLVPLPPGRVLRLRQAFLEIGSNAIEWGNRSIADRPVRVVFRAYADRVEIVVRDQGRGFDPADLPHAARPEDPLAHLDVRDRLGLREGGFGLLIARGLVDELRHAAGGAEATLVMRLDPEGPADAGTP
jgi:DNA-binding response OmpR family regulator